MVWGRFQTGLPSAPFRPDRRRGGSSVAGGCSLSRLQTEDGPIVCVGPDDELLTQFTSVYPGLRIATAAADAIAAVTPDRQRLILWHPWDGRRPFSDLFIYGLAKHRIADIAFI